MTLSATEPELQGSTGAANATPLVPASALAQSSTAAAWQGRPLRRIALGSLGVAFVAIGAVGAVLPGIPTVGPLVVASFLFSKSFPALEERLIGNKLFARFHGYLDQKPLPRELRMAGLCGMWTSILISSFCFWFAASPWRIPIVIVLLLSGGVGTVVIHRFRR